MSASYILSIDQGTSGTKAVIFDEGGKIIAKGQQKLQSNFLEGGWVEQDPEEIYQTVLTAVKNCMLELRKVAGEKVHPATVGITNQRETFVVWDEQGKPLYPAIVWQCKRSVDICNRLKADKIDQSIFEKTGLFTDPYFSGTKLLWLIENVPVVREAITAGTAMFGTIDTWLLFKLTKGERYYTDYTNASRTMLFNLSDLCWDEEILESLKVNGVRLPSLAASSFDYGASDFDGLFPEPVSIGGMIGDSQAAAFGEGCFHPGTAKATMGTGCSVLMNTGTKRNSSSHGMIATICWSTSNKVEYGLEGVIVSCGSTLEWLKREMGLVNDTREMESIATSIGDSNGVYIIPAFSGLGAPYWDMTRKAAIVGLTFDCKKSHVVRAALESIPYQIRDVIAAMEADTGISLEKLMTDGGISSNIFVLQFLADLLGKAVSTIGIEEVSALGAAYIAGLQAGIFKDLEHLEGLQKDTSVTHPRDEENIRVSYDGWKKVLEREKY